MFYDHENIGRWLLTVNISGKGTDQVTPALSLRLPSIRLSEIRPASFLCKFNKVEKTHLK